MLRWTWIFLLGWTALVLVSDCQLKDHLKPANAALRPWVSEPQKIAFMLNMNEIAGGQKAPQKCVSEVLNAWKNEKSRLAGRDPWMDMIHLVQEAPRAESVRESQCESALKGCGNCHLPRVNNCTYNITSEQGTQKRTFQGRVAEMSSSGVTLESGCGHGDCAGNRRGQERIAARDIEKTEWLNGGDELIKWWDFRTLNGRGETARKMLAISAEQGVSCAHCHVSHGDFRLTENGERFKATGSAR